MPTRLNLYISDEALPDLEAFRELVSGRGLSVSQAFHRLTRLVLDAHARRSAFTIDDLFGRDGEETI